MFVQIANFESDIDPKILGRGKQYFTDGLVVDIWSPSPGQYHAVVDGNAPYDAEITLDANGKILHHSCDCPYDWGEYCKHEVAVLLAIREHRTQGTMLKQQGEQRGIRAQLLSKSREELVDILWTLAVEHGLLQDLYLLMEEFDHEDEMRI